MKFPVDLNDFFLCELTDDHETALAESFRANCDKGQAAEMVETIITNTEKSFTDPEDIATWKSLDRIERILWIATESYVVGALTAFRIMAKANKATIEDLEKMAEGVTTL